MTIPEGAVASSRPSRSLLKRIDIGLLTGFCAVIISFMALIVAYYQTRMAQDTQKASVLPIIQVDMGYNHETPPLTFEIKLTNSGVGIAYIQRVRPTINGQSAADYTDLQNAVMNGRMRMNATLVERPGAGYLPAGESLIPWQYNWGGVSERNEILAYLRGTYGPPMQGVDVEVCYCSVFNDCWETSYENKGKPKPVATCGPDDVREDHFLNYIEQRADQAVSKE